MDRVRSPGAEVSAPRHRFVPLVGGPSRETGPIIAARSALHARAGVTQEELYLLMRDRRDSVLRASRPPRALAALGLVASGTVVCLLGSAFGGQAMVLCGFALALVGAVLACTLLADCLAPQMGELAPYMRPDEKQADAGEIRALSHAAQADPELSLLIASWWKGCGAPIRKQDLALVQNFVRAKQGR